MDILAALARDPNLSADFSRQIDRTFRRVIDARPSQIEQQHAKQETRRFLAEPPVPSAFGALDAPILRRGSDRWREVRDDERADELRDMRFGSDE